ncbi:MAG: hypothetical protein IJ215_05690 [Clostridia bacterium]|nr:hypothetical protein [Clostridia bacterium]
MGLTEEKWEKLNQLNTDDARMILKFHQYLNEKHVLLEELKEFVMHDINAKEGFHTNDDVFSIIFSSHDSVDLKGIENTEKIRIIIDISAISTGTIWHTRMRRKMKSVIDSINHLEDSEFTDKRIHKILLSDDLEETVEDKVISLDFLIEQIKQVFERSSHTDNIKVYYLLASEHSIDEEIFLANELYKFIYALRLGEKKFNYIYDTVCDDMDRMFSKFGFCDFQNDKCLSQRHKSLFGNDYPVPKKDGCCFNVYKKCNYLNRRRQLSGKMLSMQAVYLSIPC